MKEEIRKELEEIAPKLARIQRPSETPEVENTYFHHLRIDVLNEVKAREAARIRPVRRGWWTYLSLPKKPALVMMAASLALLVVAVFWLWPTHEEPDVLAGIETDELYAYIEENIDEFELSELVEAGILSQRSLFDDVETENLENYLQEEIETLDDEELNLIL